MLLGLCEFCCAGAAYLKALTFGAEGTGGCVSAPKVCRSLKCHAPRTLRPGAGGGPGEMSQAARRVQGEILSCFGAEGAARCDTWLRRTCKGAPYEAETRGAACKGVSAVRRHAGGLYDAGSYCYTLVKCLKPFVRNEKGVIEANDHTRGSPINSEPLVMERTRCNEKRAPKATASLSVFGLLSVSLLHFLFC
jgi:hypothetical protein